MSSFPLADSVLAEAIQDRAFPGAAYGVLRPDRSVGVGAVGRFTYYPDSPRVQPDTIFDLASVSKAVATTSMAMLLWQGGQFDLDEPVATRLPRFIPNNAKADKLEILRSTVTVRMLLSHCSGLPAYVPLFEVHRTASDLMNACLRMPLEVLPAVRVAYSDIGFMILGHWLEKVAGERLDSFCRREIFNPLMMNSTGYCPPASIKASVAPTGTMEPRRPRILQGEVNDGNCWVLGGISGHAGLFSNVPDTLRFAACILHNSGSLFRAETISQFTKRQSIPPGNEWALGWDTPTVASSSGQFFSRHSVGHLGYTGTSLWIDLDRNFAIVLLTNRTYPDGNAEGMSKKIKQVRPKFHDALMHDLGEA